MQFQERLRTARTESGLTQKQVYEKLNLSPNGYASYEQGRTEPNLATLKKICEILDVSADYLIGLQD
jgi:transcriptional regulator with XRE-family HTH domain